MKWERKKAREDNFTRLLQLVLQERIENAQVSVRYGDTFVPSKHSSANGWSANHDTYHINFLLDKRVANDPDWVRAELDALYEWVDGWNAVESNPWKRPKPLPGQMQLSDFDEDVGDYETEPTQI